MGIIGFLNMVLLAISPRLRNNRQEIMTLDETKIINGFFVFFIFLGHSTQYIVLNNSIFTRVYLMFDRQIGQLCVATFLFFSGYGVMESIKKKKNYISKMPRNRLIPTYSTFILSLILFYLVNVLFSIKYDLRTYIYSIFAIESIGNSNWYIFTIMWMYIITYILGRFCRNNYKIIAYVQLGISVLFIVILKFLFAFPSRFYSTVLCYSIGLIYSIYKDSINKWLIEKKIISLVSILFLIGIVILSGMRANEFGYNLYAVLFVILMVWCMNFLTFKSRTLLFMGKHCFSIYLLQRIPMIIFSEIFGDNVNEMLFIVASFVCVVLIAIPFEKLTSVITSKIKDNG